VLFCRKKKGTYLKKRKREKKKEKETAENSVKNEWRGPVLGVEGPVRGKKFNRDKKGERKEEPFLGVKTTVGHGEEKKKGGKKKNASMNSRKKKIRC